MALGYARGLRALGHCVDLLGPRDYEPFHRLRRAISYRQALGMAIASLRRRAGGGYDVLEYYGGEAWLAISLLARRGQRRPLLVCHSNGLETHCEERLRAAGLSGGERPRRWYQLSQRGLSERAFRRADALVTVSGFDRDFALGEGYAPSHRVLALDNPLPDSYLGLPVDFRRPPTIGFCGSWLARKGTDLIERDLPPLLRELPAWRLVLVGVGSGFRPERHFPEDVLPRIEAVPFARREDELRALYQSFSIAILPSVYESFGLTAAEAMACGCALVATEVGFAAGLKHGEEAYLLRSTASPFLLEGLRTLVRSDELRQRIARGGYERVQRLRWDDAVPRLAAAYAEWLAELRSPRAA